MRSSRQGVYYFVTARAQIAQLCNLFYIIKNGEAATDSSY